MDDPQNFFQNALPHLLSLLTSGNLSEITATTATSFALITAAEIGDKSQIVCMTLASRHKGLPIMLGAIAALRFREYSGGVFSSPVPFLIH